MKIKSILLTVIFFISIFFVKSCDTKDTNDLNNDAKTSRIQFNLVDAPDENYDQVWVEIIDLKYNRNDDDEGWTSFDGYPKETGDMVDLTDLIAGSSHILTDQEIESGMLSKVRLILGENNYLIVKEENDELSDPIPLKTPSAQQSGLKLKLNTELVAGYSYTFTLDWDVQKSIVKAGNSGNYNLKPVIRVIAEANSGTITGSVADKDGTTSNSMPLEALIIVYKSEGNMEEIASTFSNNEGYFILQGIPEGIYILKVFKDGYDDAELENVLVENEKDTNVGIVKLTEIPQ